MLLIKECISTRAPLRCAASSYSELILKRASGEAFSHLFTRQRNKEAASAKRWVMGVSSGGGNRSRRRFDVAWRSIPRPLETTSRWILQMTVEKT
jgi:hypothetical protein